MKQILLASAALLAVNGQQHLRRSASISDVIRPHVLPVDLEPTIPENPILQPNYPITDIPEVPEFKADPTIDTIPEKNTIIIDNEFIAIPERLRPAIPERPRFNETFIPLNITKLPIYNVTLNATRPILRLPITIDPIERPIPIEEPIYYPEDAIAADEELIAIPQTLTPFPGRPIFNATIDIPRWNETVNFPHINRTTIDFPSFNGTFEFPHWNETITLPVNRTIDFPHWNETFIPMNRTINFPHFNGTFDFPPFPINSTFEDLPKNLTKFGFPHMNRTFDFPMNSTLEDFPMNRTRFEFPLWNETVNFPTDRFSGNGTIDIRAVDPINPHIRPITIDPVERPIYIDDPIEEPIAVATADDELVAIAQIRPFNGTIVDLPYWNETITLPMNRTIDFPPFPINSTFEDLPKNLTKFGFPHWNETVTLPVDRFPIFNGTIDPRPVIPERPIHFPENFTFNGTHIPIRPIDLPITIDPIERPIPIEEPIYYPEDAIAADEELIALPERLRPAIPERPHLNLTFHIPENFTFNGTVIPLDRPILREVGDFPEHYVPIDYPEDAIAF